MDEPEQIQAFADDLRRLCDRYADEFDLSTAAAIGVLTFQVRAIEDAAFEQRRQRQEKERRAQEPEQDDEDSDDDPPN